MKVLRLLLTLVFGIAVTFAASAVYAKSGLGESDPTRFGKQRIDLVPDLVVDAIDIKFPANSTCTGTHQGTIEVAVKIRNAGNVAAVMPTWKPWVLVWSIMGGDKPPYAMKLTGPVQLAPGKTLEFNVKLAVFAKVTPDKAESKIGIGALVDPEKQVDERNEQNNMKDNQLKLLGEYCPTPGR